MKTETHQERPQADCFVFPLPRYGSIARPPLNTHLTRVAGHSARMVEQAGAGNVSSSVLWRLLRRVRPTPFGRNAFRLRLALSAWGESSIEAAANTAINKQE